VRASNPATGAKPEVIDSKPRSNTRIVATNTRDSGPKPAGPPSRRIDRSQLKRRPRNIDYPLAKALAQSRTYAGQIVAPAGMYSVYKSPNDEPGGRRVISAIQVIVDSRRADSFTTSSSEAIDLEVEADMAQRLDELGEALWRDKVSILSLWFPEGGDAVLVKLELLQSSQPRIVIGFYPKGDVEYGTYVITPEDSKAAKGLDEDWEKVGRMQHFAKVVKHKVNAYKHSLKQREATEISTVMAGMYNQMLRGAADAAANQAALQRAVGGR
jgi:hypothetical protein